MFVCLFERDPHATTVDLLKLVHLGTLTALATAAPCTLMGTPSGDVQTYLLVAHTSIGKRVVGL